MPAVASKQLFHISTSVIGNCPVCGAGGEKISMDDSEYFEKMCNHLFEHGLKCLHVGQETSRDDQGKPWQSTVAVFGK